MDFLLRRPFLRCLLIVLPTGLSLGAVEVKVIPSPSPIAADSSLSLPHIFSDHMMVQRDAPVPVWGKATPGQKIKVLLGGHSADAKADADGNWRASLPSLKAGGPFDLEVEGGGRITIHDVLVGEVWFAGGQSNMRFTIDKGKDAAAETAAADFPQIRMFNATPVVAAEPQTDVAGKWLVCSPQNARELSAVAYFFAREIHRELHVPVGIVHSSEGWTPGEAWLSREALATDPDLAKDLLSRWDKIVADYPAAKLRYQDALNAWEADEKRAKDEGRAAPRKPRAPTDPNFAHRAAGLWNGSVAPLVRYSVRGVIWYQGETNDQRGYQYRKLFPALIADWRKKWGQPDLPFLFVQLANVLPPDPTPAESEWAEVREAQLMALVLPRTGMAVTIDIGEEKDVHPKNKQDVGHRLALLARARVYGQDLDDSGPSLKKAMPEHGGMRLVFDHVNKGLCTPDGGVLKGFAIAGQDRKFLPAEATIDGDGVFVRNETVNEPVAVRYAWANNPIGSNLFSRTRNAELLPASPFRTDDWPGKSYGVVKLPIDP